MRTLVLVFAACAANHAPPLVNTAPAAGVATATEECTGLTIEEWVCGPTGPDASTCAARGDSVWSIDQSDLAVTELRLGTPLEQVERATLRDFVLDPAATAAYQRELKSEGEVSSAEILGSCCYRNCSPFTEPGLGPLPGE